MISSRFILTLFFIMTGLIFCFSAESKDLMIVPETESTTGCDLAEAGFDEKEGFLKFFPQLKQAIKTSDAKKISVFILFPLKVNGKKTIVIKDSLEFESQFKMIMTTKLIKIIDAQKLENLSCQYQGVMFGDGEIWVQKKKAKIGISAVNPF